MKDTNTHNLAEKMMKGSEKQIKYAQDLIEKINNAEIVTKETMEEYGYSMADIMDAPFSQTSKRKTKVMFKAINEMKEKIDGEKDAGNIINAIKNHRHFHLIKERRTI